MNLPLAPIALFVYNRPEHTRVTLETLRVNQGASESDLIVFSDGAKSPDAEQGVSAVRGCLKRINGFRSVEIVESGKNLGLANSIIGGVTEVLTRYDRVIVMEDDLLTAPFFLRYMNEGLEFYESDERVASIHGYTYPVGQTLPETFFLRGADCWGWACWQRSWRLFQPNGRLLLSELKRRSLTRQFDLDGAYPFTQMLRDQIRGANNSWAVRWHASAFLAGKLTLYPGRSLVHNTGNDLSGSHGSDTTFYDVELANAPIHVGGAPVEESAVGRAAFIKFMRRGSRWRNPRLLLSAVVRRLTRRA
jgi:hypothetical protein